ncbi:hypothetical protein QA639_09395 [Bradyrhizobium pachyrhizi]|uniref:hypothetical protein n=1 Tax=Bradyrhizobium TaxID=374 RepID=UPI0024B053D0|nr:MULTISPECIES: hypothetical protein [Bradyrhizobium]WFU57703.1 hypothetical protein QA639_09395 [Bradyrhizobium pachyrhizi]WOH83249.1 hypothetical protein RX327_08955 [Bradyrhizobium sp. BEA-2-5]
MRTVDEYLQLSLHYRKAAASTADIHARYQLEMLARSYMTLAESTRVLEQTAPDLSQDK